MAKSNQSLGMGNFTPDQIAMATQAIKNAKDITCSCGNAVFNQGVKLKQLSRLLTGSDRDELIPIPTLYCNKCSLELVSDEENPIKA